MRFSYAESMTDPSYYLPLARAAEEAGYDSMVIPDSICYPKESGTTYPFNPDGSREFLEDKPFLEPFSAVGGAVRRAVRGAGPPCRPCCRRRSGRSRRSPPTWQRSR